MLSTILACARADEIKLWLTPLEGTNQSLVIVCTQATTILDKTKMEQQTPIPPPPKSRMKPREVQIRAIFPSLIWGGGGGRGDLGFPFILSKIVVLFF